MKQAMIVMLTALLIPAAAVAQWDLVETFDSGIPAGWTVTYGDWEWVEDGDIFPTSYIRSGVDLSTDAILISAPVDIADATFLVYQCRYYVSASDGLAFISYGFSPDGPWTQILSVSSPYTIVRGVCNFTLDEADILGDEIYFRYGHYMSPDGGVYDLAIDDVRVSTQLPGWVSIELDSNDYLIPPGGGWFDCDVTLRNTLPFDIENMHFCFLMQTWYGPIVGPYRAMTATLPAMSEIQLPHVHRWISGDLPYGEYAIYACAGFPNNPEYQFTDFHMIHKFGSRNGADEAADDYADIWRQVFAGDADSEYAVAVANDGDQLPRFELNPASPNPFNAATTISVTLPVTADLTLTVHNTLGQQVAELADGAFSARTHEFTLDGSHLASGIYFVHAAVPGELSTVQKLVLLK